MNLGIWAACIPMMKPLTRYLYALFTGKDVHDPRRSSQLRTPIFSWDNRARWFSRWSPTRRSHWSQGSSGHERVVPLPSTAEIARPTNTYRMIDIPQSSARVAYDTKANESNCHSIVLPLQGCEEPVESYEGLDGRKATSAV